MPLRHAVLLNSFQPFQTNMCTFLTCKPMYIRNMSLSSVTAFRGEGLTGINQDQVLGVQDANDVL